MVQVFSVKQFPDLMAFSQNKPILIVWSMVCGCWGQIYFQTSLRKGEVRIFLTAKIEVLYFKCNKINLEESKRFVLDESYTIPISYFEIYKKPHATIKNILLNIK